MLSAFKPKLLNSVLPIQICDHLLFIIELNEKSNVVSLLHSRKGVVKFKGKMELSVLDTSRDTWIDKVHQVFTATPVLFKTLIIQKVYMYKCTIKTIQNEIIADLYKDESVWASIGMSLWKMSGPDTLGSVGWNGMGFTRGAAVNQNQVCDINQWELLGT